MDAILREASPGMVKSRSAMRLVPDLSARYSQCSSTSTAQLLKIKIKRSNLYEEIGQKLSYEWKNIFRSLVSHDDNQTGEAAVSLFNTTCFNLGVILTREDVRKLVALAPGNTAESLNYVELSKKLGLHKANLDAIKTYTLSSNQDERNRRTKLSQLLSSLQVSTAIKKPTQSKLSERSNYAPVIRALDFQD